ncbi:MAG: thrombospondin type 3 repeat-containing protein [Candidatus Poseidoniales archaeon]
MNKTYLLILCLLSTSFVGCLDTDEDETLEPLGTDENNESSYDGLKAEIKNLTNEIEKLHDDLKSLESYQYNPPEESTINFTTYDYDSMKLRNEYVVEKNGNDLKISFVGKSPHYIETENLNSINWTYNTNCDGNQTNDNNASIENDDCDNDGIKNNIDNCPLTANNNQNDQDGDGIGDVCDSYPNLNNKSNSPCTYSSFYLTIYNSGMDIIRKGSPILISESYERNCVLKEGYQNNYEDDFGSLWSKAYFSLEEEPVRIEINGQILTF